MRRILGLGRLVLSLTLPAAARDPVLVKMGERWLGLSELPPIFGDEEVRRQLTSGLTTTFIFSVEGRGSAQGGARVEVRYLLWDEVFQVTVLEMDGRVQRESLPSQEALAAWWRKLRLTALDVGTLSRSPPRQLRVRLDVVPFSSKEEADTERWLSETLARAGRGRGGAVAPGEVPGDSLGQVFNTLLATSIRRRAVRSYRWTVSVPARGPGREALP